MFSPGQVRRLPNGYRDYTPEAEQRQALVLAGRAAGFGLDDMRTRMHHWSTRSDAERADILRDQLEVLDARIGELDRSRREIAAVLGCSPGTARTRMHRARARLREALTRRGVHGPGVDGPGTEPPEDGAPPPQSFHPALGSEESR